MRMIIINDHCSLCELMYHHISSSVIIRITPFVDKRVRHFFGPFFWRLTYPFTNLQTQVPIGEVVSSANYMVKMIKRGIYIGFLGKSETSEAGGDMSHFPFLV